MAKKLRNLCLLEEDQDKFDSEKKYSSFSNKAKGKVCAFHYSLNKIDEAADINHSA